MMNQIFTALLLLISIAGYSQAGNQITGKWKAEDESKTLQVEIVLYKDGNYYGKVINDNSSPSKNGTVAIKNLEYNETAKTCKGTMHPPDASLSLNVTITLESINRLKLVAKKWLMSKTMYLIRIK